MRSTLFLALFGLAAGVAVVSNPRPWSQIPSNTGVCGNGRVPVSAMNAWVAGSTQTVSWQVIASTGFGQLDAAIDPAGGMDFTAENTIALTGSINPQTVGIASVQLTVPARPAAGCPVSGCTIRIKSASGWVSCISVDIASPGTAPSPMPSPSISCVEGPEDLSICTGLRERDLLYYEPNYGFKAMEADIQVFQKFVGNVSSVFSKGYSAKCAEEMTEFLCGLFVKSCDSARRVNTGKVCNSRCENAMKQCGLAKTHSIFFECNSYQEFNGDALGVCPVGRLEVGGKEAAVVIVAFVVVALAAFGGYLRNKKWASPNLGYKSTIGILAWLAALVGMATAAQSVHYARQSGTNYRTFDAKSYVNYLVAANLIAWLLFTLFFALDFKKTIGEGLRKTVVVIDVILWVMTLAAAAAATDNFSGSLGYCSLRVANLNQCTTYQASIFFTYVVMLCLAFKLLVTFLSGRSQKSAGDRSKV